MISLDDGKRRRQENVLDKKRCVLDTDFGIPSGASNYIQLVGERVFGVQNTYRLDHPDIAAAITNRTAPGLYVREGDDTSNWEEYRQVLARRVVEATGGGASVASTATGFREDLWRRICWAYIEQDLYVPDRENFTLTQLDQLAENEVTRRLVAQAGREAIQRPMGSGGIVDSSGRIVDVRFDDGLAEYVRPLGRVSDNHTSNAPRVQPRTIEVTLNPATPAQAVRLTEEMRRITERVVREEIAAAQPQPKPELTRFGLLEVDLPAQPSKTTPKADTDLAGLQATFRIEREQRRAQAAAQAQKGRFDLIECDLPAVPVKAVSTFKPVEPKVKPMPKPAPVTQIVDLTKARDVVELANMVACVEAEVAMSLWRRETN